MALWSGEAHLKSEAADLHGHLLYIHIRVLLLEGYRYFMNSRRSFSYSLKQLWTRDTVRIIHTVYTALY